MSEAVRCIVLDFDGVLLDSNQIKRLAYFEVFADAPLPCAAVEDCLAAYAEGDRYDVIGCILAKLPDGASRELIDRYAGEYGRRCDVQIRDCEETMGASQVIASLSSSYPLYVNSATPVDSLREYLAARQWTAYFRGILGRPNNKVVNLRSVCAQERLSARQILFVGDHQSDFAAARTAGCRFVAVRSNGNDFNEPVDMLETLEVLPDYLRRLNGRSC